jgi:hypothetical protein
VTALTALALDVLVPTATVTTVVPTAASRLRRDSHYTIGFLSNTKPGADTLLSLLAVELGRRIRFEAVFATKSSSAIVVPTPLVGELAARCHGIITALGD